jgi:putative oxidoreductase
MMKGKILMVLCVLFGLGMIVFGANKLFPFMPMPELTEQQKTLFGAFGTIKWLMPLVAFAEIAGGLLIAITGSITRALGAIVILPVMVGILLHNLTFFDQSGIMIAAVFALINLWAIVDSKNKYKAMIQ